MRFFILPALAITALSACSSGGDRTIEEISDRGLRIVETHGMDTGNFTDPASLPETGSTRYDGIIALVVDTSVLGGDVSITANWRDDSVSGQATNFLDEENSALSGSLAITNGTIDRTADVDIDFTVVADVDGTLRGGGNNYDFDMTYLADFYGTNQAAIGGITVGQVVVNDARVEDVDGYMVAER